MKRFIYNSGRKVFVYNGEFREEDHPRGEDGKFGGGGGYDERMNPKNRTTKKDREDVASVNIPLSKRGDIDTQIDKFNKQLEKDRKEYFKEKETKQKDVMNQRREEAKKYYEAYADDMVKALRGKASATDIRNLLKSYISVDPERLIKIAKKWEQEKQPKQNSRPRRFIYRANP